METEALQADERFSKEELRALLTRRDGPGWMRLAVQLPLLLGAGYATVRLAADGNRAWIAAVGACGVMLVTMFPALHEAGHGTAFRTRVLNDALSWLGAVLMLQSPSFFREFHWEHHRHTQDRTKDPEISAAPDVLAPWPANPAMYLALASGQHLLVGKLMFTVACALIPGERAWNRFFPFIRPRMRSRVRWESVLVLALLGSSVAAGWAFVPGFPQLLWAWPVAHLVLGLYVMPEHTGLPHDGSQFHRTRSLLSNGLVRFLMWNMPLHAEHHAYPAIPFHHLPALHQRLLPELEHLSPGYLSFHLQALAAAFNRGRAPSPRPE
jgi:fatty acid desaturase